jgi:hypothetical protein
MRKTVVLFFLISIMGVKAFATEIFIPMDEEQKNHLKAYGLTYWVLSKGVSADWLLNYRGGSFAMPWAAAIEAECNIRGVTYQVLANGQYNKIKEQIAYPETNQDVVKLEKPPKIAVYSPKTDGKPLFQPWDDAVTLVLKYAEIPYDVIFDDEVLQNKLPLYDWLHLHHEDFTGQYGKFWSQYANYPWYQAAVKMDEETASKWGYPKVSQLKLAVVKKIRDFVMGGGYMFAMCSATDTYDIALAADGIDICETPFDGDPMDPQANSKLDFSKTFAFQNFTVVTDPREYEFSSIDVPPGPPYRMVTQDNDYFTLFEYSAKWDQIPTMLTQDHMRVIKGFMGQTTAFKKQYVKPTVTIMGENKSLNEAKYIHGEFGKGMWTFYGGHDPEDYQHLVNNPPTDLSLHPNSPGYRLILNNVLFPAAKRQKQKT